MEIHPRTLRLLPRGETLNGQICTKDLPGPPRRKVPRAGRKIPPGSAIEKHHEERYRALLKNVEQAEVFKKSEVKVWECRNCGHIVIGTDAPEICPTCAHPQAYFEVTCGKLLEKFKTDCFAEYGTLMGRSFFNLSNFWAY